MMVASGAERTTPEELERVTGTEVGAKRRPPDREHGAGTPAGWRKRLDECAQQPHAAA